jgi:penicillin-binding protein-related factor A (putative recombinase)
VEPHQAEFLTIWTVQPGAIGFVLVSFKFADFYLIPWVFWEAAHSARERKAKAVLESMGIVWQATGRASIRKDELPEEWKVKIGGAAALDYLTTVKKLWRIEQ